EFLFFVKGKRTQLVAEFFIRIDLRKIRRRLGKSVNHQEQSAAWPHFPCSVSNSKISVARVMYHAETKSEIVLTLIVPAQQVDFPRREPAGMRPAEISHPLQSRLTLIARSDGRAERQKAKAETACATTDVDHFLSRKPLAWQVGYLADQRRESRHKLLVIGHCDARIKIGPLVVKARTCLRLIRFHGLHGAQLLRTNEFVDTPQLIKKKAVLLGKN